MLIQYTATPNQYAQPCPDTPQNRPPLDKSEAHTPYVPQKNIFPKVKPASP